jgi:hypothetical protein
MELTNGTKLSAGYTLSIRKDGRELLVVVAKATFTLPRDGQAPEFAESQVPLVDRDRFTGEPARSAPLYEIDYSPFKPYADVLLNGSAYAPQGRSTARVPVELRVGSMRKAFSVVGERSWQRRWRGLSASEPVPFTRQKISYNCAFGGVEYSPDDLQSEHWYPANHAGIGAHKRCPRRALVGTSLPRTEELERPITNPYGEYNPMALGPVARAWQPRARWAGTYDQNWVDRVMPFLPADFDDRYFQAAPMDQQTDHLQGGEPVQLKNLTEEGLTRFVLPVLPLSATFVLSRSRPVDLRPVLDTLILEPDEERLMLVWRCALPLPRNVFDVEQVTLRHRI